MALDRPFDDGDWGAAAKQQARRRGPDAEAATARPRHVEAAEARAADIEPRGHAEYFEALYGAQQVADGKSGQPAEDNGGSGEPAGSDSHSAGKADHGPDTETDRPGTADRLEAKVGRGGWDALDALERLPPEAIRLSPERVAHILDGDPTRDGGGHRHGTGKPGKTEFPADWDDQKVIDTVLDVARRPDQRPTRQEWNSRWSVRGTRDDVEIVVILAGDGRIWTAWPLPGGAGVVKNPEES